MKTKFALTLCSFDRDIVCLRRAAATQMAAYARRPGHRSASPMTAYGQATNEQAGAPAGGTTLSGNSSTKATDSTVQQPRPAWLP